MAPVQAPKKSSKPIFKTDTPFTETKWPIISPKDQDIILDLICTLLEPIGHHRRTHIRPSKGPSRNKKRKRNAQPTPSEDEDPLPPPPPPELNKHILVGLNSVTRHLSALAARTCPASLPISQKTGDDSGQAKRRKDETRYENGEEREENTDLRPVSLIILPHPSPPSSLPHAHIPTLLYLSTLPPAAQKPSQKPSSSPPTTSIPPTASTTPPPTRLITLPSSTEARLATTLNIPRCGAIGILEGAPGTETLVEYAREHVGVVECRWVEEAMGAEWRGVKTRLQEQK